MADPAYTYNEDEKNRLWTHRLDEEIGKPTKLSSTVVLSTVIPILLGAIWMVLLIVALR